MLWTLRTKVFSSEGLMPYEPEKAGLCVGSVGANGTGECCKRDQDLHMLLYRFAFAGLGFMDSAAGRWMLVWVMGQFGGSFPRGLKPRFILMHFTYGLKPVPFNVTHYLISGCAIRPGR